MADWKTSQKGDDRSISVMFECCFSVQQVYGGMRGMKGLVYETSVLDPDEVSTHTHTHIMYCQPGVAKM